MAKSKAKLNAIMSELTGQPLEKVALDTDRDHYLTADEAKDYGIVDKVLSKREAPPEPNGGGAAGEQPLQG